MPELGDAPLVVLSVAYPFAPVRSDTAGGAEQVLAMLDRGLTGAGHKSIVIAAERSQIAGSLFPVAIPEGTLDQAERRQVAAAYRRAIAELAGRARIDVIHLHGIDFLDYLPAPGIPTLVTLHLPPSWYPPAAFAIDRPVTWLHCVSQSQQAACSAAGNMLPPIENGVSETLHAPHVHKRNFALSLGRICPEKGYHHAFEATRRAGIDFLLAGQVFPYRTHQHYYETEILPRCNKHRRFIGPVNLRRKRRLLTAARCFLIPSLAPETSSLVAMEALMCGTPVIAFRAGALAGIIEPGRTGFLVQNESEMADAIHEVAAIDPRVCRKTALARFSERTTIAQYLALYRRIACR